MHRRISRNLCSLLKVHYAMEEVVRAYEVLKKTRTIKKGLLTRCVNRLRAVVGQGADVQADTVDDARRRARLLLEELNNINVQMETVLLENDIAREDDEEGVSRPTARFVDVESNVEEVTAREIEIDKLQTGWTHDTQPADANANADVLAKTLEALSIITDKLVTPRESASIRTTGMHPPRWDGQNKNFYSWRLQLEQYFNSAGISKEADKLMYILHASVLPSRVTASIDSCTAMSGPNGVWCRLEEKIPKAAVVQEIIADMDGIRPIRQNAASEMRAVLDRLTDFARRITEIGNESELDSPTVVRIVSSKLEPELYYECERWMRQNHPAEQLSVNRIVEFLRAETEARERLMPAKSTRTEKKSSLHHVNGTGTSFTDPCILGCGVHHKFIDCQAFQAMQPAQRRDVIRTDGRCFSCYGRHRSSDCTRPKRCIECGDRHHRLLNCQPNRQLSAPTSTTRRTSPPTSQMNPASASFTPQQGAATSTPTFLGHLHGNQGRFSPSTYVEVRDSTGAWHKIVAFLDTGSDTTLVRHSLAKRLGITGDDQVFRYGVAGGGVRSEKSARYVLRVRPVQRDASIAYDINAMGIKVPAHDAPAIDSSLFQQYEYLQPARDCVPLAKEKIDLLVGYDQAYLISTLHTISSPTNEAQLPSAACTRLGWVLYGGQIQPPRAVARSAVHHVQRLIEDDIKKLFYSDVAGVKPTTACICSDKELAESKFLLHAKTTTSITKEGRIKVFMPWRDGYPEALPFNKKKTVARMYQQENSLRRNGRLEAYNAEIRNLPSNMNAADALTKPLSVRELQYWHEGPLFLRQHEDTWPQESTCEQDSEIEAATRIEGRNEKARTPRHRRIHHVRANDVCIADMTIADRLVAQVSEWDRLTRHVARWRRILQPRVNRADTRTIGAEELKDAQQALFFLCQSEFREDFAACRSTFASIAPVLDAKGIVRAEGRIGQLPLHPDVCHPIILPGNSPLVELYARRKHIRYLHQGYRVVLANIAKEGIHIGNGKELLKSVASKCLYCRTRRESMLQQQMGILPAFRGNPCTPPFAAVAVDFFGPLQTKVSRNVTTESSVMIVTCTTTRVVHLELTSSASTESFLLAWRRFVSRRGVHPTTVFSDRGKNFQGAQRPLRDAIDSWDVSRLKRELAAERTHFEWQFNVPKASHMNGVVESLIRSCRRGLDAAVNYLKRRFTFKEWQTFLSEVMYVINSRPLFPDGPDPVGSPAVTGNDILHPFDQPTVPQPVIEDRPHPRDVVKALHQRVQLFWETWLRYMPPHLIARSKWFHSRQNLQVGDLVLLLEPGMKGAAAPRALWERAVVTAVQPGDDGLVRKATVRTANARLYDRPIHKMCLIATDDELSNGLRRK